MPKLVFDDDGGARAGVLGIGATARTNGIASPQKRQKLSHDASVLANGHRSPSPTSADPTSHAPNGSTTLDSLAAAAVNGANGTDEAGPSHAAPGRSRADRQERAAALKPIRAQLPIANGKEAILTAIMANDTIVLLGETGSGKTTQVPQFLLEASVPCPKPRIAITQPRRVAAISLATRVAEEVGCALGKLVGYSIRFEDVTGPATQLKYLTDGTLLQELLTDRALAAYDVVIVDEAHERTLRTDMLLGFLKRVQRERKAGAVTAADGTKLGPLKIVVMSATLEAERFSKFFGGAKVMFVKGRTHKIRVFHTAQPTQDPLDAVVTTVVQICAKQPPGDVLVFLSGEDAVEATRASLNGYAAELKAMGKSILVVGMYARLPQSEQAKVFAPVAAGATRKIILATNIAETSITIPGVKYVVDTGLMKEKRFYASLSLASLLEVPISQSSAQQRAGRCGREAAGTCYRLYTEQSFSDMPKTQAPEMQRSSLSFTLLHLLAAGQEDIKSFEFMDPPKPEALDAAERELIGLGAIDDAGKLTDRGRQMSRFPLEPMSSRILLAAFEHGCPSDVITLLAALSVEHLVLSPAAKRDEAAAAHAPFRHPSGDHATLLNMVRAYDALGPHEDRRQWAADRFLSAKGLSQVDRARKQLQQRCTRLDLDWVPSCGDDLERVVMACATGLVTQAAIKQPDGHYRTLMGCTDIQLHPSSVLHGRRPNVVIFQELVYTTKTYARTASAIKPEWLRDSAPSLFGRRSA